MRRGDDAGKMGNRVSAWILRLPIERADPRSWVSGIREVTSELKNSQRALGLEMIMQAAEYAPPSLMALGARAASGPINMIVTNVPGPQFPLYTLGAKLLELHPLVPLLDGTGLGIALFSYDGNLHVGLNAEYELVPDLGAFTALFAQSFMAISDAAGIDARATRSSEDPVAPPSGEAEAPEVPIGPLPSLPQHDSAIAVSAAAARGSSRSLET
jgi:hypothetical protein